MINNLKKWLRSLSLRMAFFSSLFIVSVVVLLGGYFFNQQKELMLKDIESELEVTWSMLAETLNTAVFEEDVIQLERVLSNLLNRGKYGYIEAVSLDGSSLYSSGLMQSDTEIEILENILTRHLIREHLNSASKPLVIKTNLTLSGQPVGSLYALINLENYEHELNLHLIQLALFILVVALISLFVMVEITRRVHKPLKQLNEFTKQVINGEQKVRLEEKGSSELEFVAESFNRMLEHLDERDKRLSGNLQREALRSSILAKIVNASPLSKILADITNNMENLLGDYYCSILLLDDEGKRLVKGVAPNLPASYLQALDGVEIGPAAGSCGTAAYINKRVIVDDIQSHSFWTAYKDIAMSAGLAACWSEPIRNAQGSVLGTLAVYSSKIDDFENLDDTLIEDVSTLASLAIEHCRLSEKAANDKEFIEVILNNVSEGIVACNQEGLLTLFNPQAAELHGLEAETLPPERWAEHYSLFMADGRTLMQKEEVPLYRALKGELVRDIEMVIKPVKSPPKRLLANGQQLRNHQDQVIGAVVSLTDVTRDMQHTELLNVINRSQAEFLHEFHREKGFERLLEGLLQLTDSEYGFIGEVLYKEEKPYLKTYAITDISWDDATHTFYQENAPTGLEFFNLDTLFGAALVTGEVVISNNPKEDSRAGGIPKGHPPLNAFLGIPIFAEDNMVAMVGIANRPQGYDDSVLKLLSPLLSTIGRLVEAGRLREDLRQNEQRLVQSQKFSNVGSWEWTIKTGQLYWSDRVAPIFGYEEGELNTSYDNFMGAVHPDDREQIEMAIQNCIDGNDYYVEHRIIWPDGTIRWVEETGDAVRDNDGNAIKIFGMVRDTTEKKALLAELQEQKNSNEEILQNMVDAVVTIDQNGIMQTFNKAAENLFGYSKDEVIGKNVSMLMPETYARNHDRYLENYCKTDMAKVIGTGRELEGVDKEGKVFPIWLSVSEMSKSKNGHRIFVGTCHDLSVLKEQETLIRRSLKMDALGKLTGGIAHDYNNMLGIILGYSEILALKFPPGSDNGDHIQQILKAAKRSRDITKGLLGFAKFRAEEEEIIDTSELLIKLEPLMQKSLTPSHPLVLNPIEGAPKIRVSKGELEDALLNLVINAKHAMPSGGRISVDSEIVVVDNVKAGFLGVDVGDYLKLSISDNGVGMNTETQSKIFDPFFTTKGEGGTGLGLSQVYGFVERSRGSIKVYSELGKGTTFNIYFPLVNNDEFDNKKAIKSEEPSKVNGNQQVVLVVDDEPGLRNLARDLLKANSFIVFTAGNGMEALNVLKNNSVDVVLSDVIMPVMDGYELKNKIDELYPDIPVQFTSGFNDTSKSPNQRKLLVKPYNIRELLSTVSELLKQNKNSI